MTDDSPLECHQFLWSVPQGFEKKNDHMELNTKFRNKSTYLISLNWYVNQFFLQIFYV